MSSKIIRPVNVKNNINHINKDHTSKKLIKKSLTGMINSTQVKVFPITYYHLSMNDNDELKDLLVDKILEDSKDLKIPDGWFTNKLLTSFDGEPRGKEIFFGEDQTYQKILEKRYFDCINAIFDAPYKIDIDEIWYNVYINGEWQEDHDHVGGPYGAHYSCIHFLSFDKENHQPVQFRDPMGQIRNLSVELDRTGYCHTWSPNIKEGDFIMFPSYLSHCVRPGKPTPDYPRITIAFNFRVLDYKGKRND